MTLRDRVCLALVALVLATGFRGGRGERGGDGAVGDDFAKDRVDGRVHAEDFLDDGAEEGGREGLVFEGLETALAVRVVFDLLGKESFPVQD